MLNSGLSGPGLWPYQYVLNFINNFNSITRTKNKKQKQIKWYLYTFKWEALLVKDIGVFTPQVRIALGSN